MGMDRRKKKEKSINTEEGKKEARTPICWVTVQMTMVVETSHVEAKSHKVNPGSYVGG